MKRMVFLGLLLAFALLGGWFAMQPGERQLDLADRVSYGLSSPARLDQAGLAYGPLPRQKLDVHVPADRARQDGDALPVLVFFHGGSWNSGSRTDYGFVARALADKGVIVVLPDYRLVPDGKFPAMVEDSAAALAFVADQARGWGGDPQRLFVAGHSAGAYNAVMAALDRQYLGRLGKDSSIIRGVIALAGPYDFLPFTSDAARDALGHWPRLDETQPVHYARGDGPPLLLLTGTDDTTVRSRNSARLAEAVSAAGGVAGFTDYPGIDHADIIMALARPFRGKAPVLDDLTGFLRAHGAFAAPASPQVQQAASKALS